MMMLVIWIVSLAAWNAYLSDRLVKIERRIGALEEWRGKS
jgi:hypothetical protein